MSKSGGIVPAKQLCVGLLDLTAILPDGIDEDDDSQQWELRYFDSGPW